MMREADRKPHLMMRAQKDGLGTKVETNDFIAMFAGLKGEEDGFGTRNTAGLSDAGIAQTQELLGADFPENFVWFLQSYWTGMFGAVDLYTLDEADHSYIGVRQPAGASGKFVAFADDGFGNAYCFPVLEGRCRDEVVIVPTLASEYTGDIEYDCFLQFVAANA